MTTFGKRLMMNDSEFMDRVFGDFYGYLCNCENQDFEQIDGRFFLIDRSSWGQQNAFSDGIFTMFDSSESAEVFNMLPALIARNPSVQEVELYYVGEHQHAALPLLPPHVCITLLPLHEAWKRRWSVVTEDNAIGEYVRSMTAGLLSGRLKALEMGSGVSYENLVYDILYFSALPLFDALRTQDRTADGFFRRDIIAELTQGSVLQVRIQNEGLRSNQVIFEVKNERRTSGQNIDSVLKYLSVSSPASVGFLITRSMLSAELRKRCAAERMKAQGQILIVPMSDDDLHNMLDAIRSNSIRGVEYVLINHMLQSLRDCH